MTLALKAILSLDAKGFAQAAAASGERLRDLKGTADLAAAGMVTLATASDRATQSQAVAAAADQKRATAQQQLVQAQREVTVAQAALSQVNDDAAAMAQQLADADQRRRQALDQVAAAQADVTAAQARLTAANDEAEQVHRALIDAEQARRQALEGLARIQIQSAAAAQREVEVLDLMRDAVRNATTADLARAQALEARIRQARDGAVAELQVARAAAQATGDYRAMAEAARNLQGVQGQLTAVQTAQAAIVRQIRDQYVPLEVATRQYEAALKELDAAERAGILTDKEAAAARAQVSASLRQAEEAHRRQTDAANAGGQSTRLAAHEVTNLSYQLQDAAVQLAGGQNPFLILMQQGPQAAGAVGGVSRLLSLMMSPVLLATTAVVALGVGFAAAAGYISELAAETRSYETRLKALNPQIDLSVQKYRALAKEIAAAKGVSNADAATAIQRIVVVPTIRSTDLVRDLAGLSQDIAAVLGQDVGEWAEKLAKSFGKGAAGVRELDGQLSFLTASQAASIRALEAQGKQTEALSVAIAALEGRFGGAARKMQSEYAQAMTTMGNAWDDFLKRVFDEDVQKRAANVANAIANAIKAMAPSTEAERNLDRLVNKMEALKMAQEELDEARARGALGIGVLERNVAALVEEVEALQRKQATNPVNRLPDNAPTSRPAASMPQSSAFTPEEEKRINDAKTALDRYREGLQGVGLARQLAAAGAQAYYAEIEKGGRTEAAERQRQIAQQQVLADHDAAMRELALTSRLAADAQDRLAAAAGKGEAAQRAANDANIIAEAQARSATEADLAREAAKRREAAAVKQIANEAIGDLRTEADANERMTAALKLGGAAIAANAREEYRLTMQRKLGVDAVEKLNEVMAEYDRWRSSEVAKAEAGVEGQRLSDLREELALLERRNKLLAQQAKGGAAGLKAGAAVAQLDIQAQIDEQVLTRQRELLALSKQVQGINVETETLKYRFALEEQARLEHQIETQRLAARAADTLGNLFTRIEAGDWGSVAEGVGTFMSQFRDLEVQTGSAGEAFAALGEQLLDSAEAGYALGNLVGDLFGRSEQQNKNARIGSTIATTVGDMFGLPKGLTSFVGNVIGGLFGPGKSDSTAGVQIRPSTDKVTNFDTKPDKQSSENMSARDALADSVNKFTNLLSELTGGRLADAIAIEVGSRDGNRWRVYGANGQLAESGTTAVGDIEGTLSQVLAAITRTLTDVPDELKARLQSIDFSELERAQADVNFVLAYDGAIKKLNGTLEGGSDAVATAKKNVVDMRNYVTDFAAQAGRLGYDAGETADALRIYVERFAGIKDAAPAMTEVEVKVAALNASFSELAPLLAAVGYSAADASDAVAKGLAKAKEAAKADWVGQMDREFNSLIGNEFVNQLNDLLKSRETQYRNADALGVDRNIVNRNVGAALGGIVTTDLRADQLQEIIRLFGTSFPEAAAAAQTALNELSGAVSDTGSAAADAAAALKARTGTLLDSLADRMARATGASETLAGALEIFDRSATAEKADVKERIAAGEIGAEALTALEQTQGAERAAIVKKFGDAAVEAEKAIADKRLAITRSLEDRAFALSVKGQTGASVQILYRQQQAEFAAAVAAGYTAEQLHLLVDVLAGEMVDAVNAVNQASKDAADAATAAAKAVNDNFSDRLFAATTDTNTLEGALATFDRQAGKDRIEAAKTVGANLVLLEQAQGAERAAIIAKFNAAAAQALAAVNTSIADRLFNATNDNSTLEGALAAFDRQANKDRIEAAKTAGADMVGLEQAIAAERGAIIKRFAQVSIDAEKQRLDALRQAGGSLRQWIDSVRGGGAVGTTAQTREIAQRQFDQQLALAKSGNVEAVQGLREYAQRLIDAQTPFTASGADRRAMVEAILTQLETVPAVKSYDQQVLEALQGLKDGIDVGVDLEVIRTITEVLSALPTEDRDRLIQAQKVVRAIEEHLGRQLTAAELDQLVEDGQITRDIQQWLGRDLTASERAALVQADQVERRIEQLLGRQLTASEAASLVQDGPVLRSIMQQIGAASGAELILGDAVTRKINQVLTIQGQVLSSEALSQQIAIELGNVQFQGQALANRYLAAIAWNTARLLGASGGGLLVTDDPNTAGDQSMTDGRAAATLSVSGGGTDSEGVIAAINGAATKISHLHTWMTQVWAVESKLLDRTTYNTAETAKKLGGGYSYAGGTDFHPGGWALVGEEGPEYVHLPRAAQVFTRDQSLELARRPRSVVVGVTGGGGDNAALTAAIERQARATERQNALLEKIADATGDGAAAAAETAKALKAPARAKVGTIAKLRGAA